MENQYRKITGYRDLTQPEIDAINSIKALEINTASVVSYLKSLPDVDQRAIAIAVTNLQQAYMWLTKAVAKSHNPFS